MPRYSLRGAKRRQAAILFVCVVLLTLFLVVGLCFVLFADAQATSSRFYREAHLNLDEYPSPEELFGWGLGSLIYPNHDDMIPNNASVGAGPLCAARGHELARTMYGWNYQLNAQQTDVDGLNNYTAFNGIGRPITGPGTTQNPWGVDDQKLVSYVYYPGSNDPSFANNNNNLIGRGVGPDAFKRNPERVGVQANGSGGYGPGLYAGGFNPPYTYADLNHVYLADIGMGQTKPDTWTTYAKKLSFWRGEDTGFKFPGWNGNSLDANNPSWCNPGYPGGPYTSPQGGYDSRLYKYLSLRPRPVDQLMPSEIQQLSGMTAAAAEQQIKKWATPGDPDQRLFPLPNMIPLNQYDYGDVRNLPGAGPYDSIWIDLAYGSIKLAGSQKKVKPMFAVTIVDLDGRVNMNIAGNTTESSQTGYGYHGSNQGFGPWEINPRWLLAASNNSNATAGMPCVQSNGVFAAGGDFWPDSGAPTNWRNEYLNLFRGAYRTTSGVSGPAGSFAGRYGLKPDGQWDPRYWSPLTNPDPRPLPSQFPYPHGAGAGLVGAPTTTPMLHMRADVNGSSVRSPQPPPGAPPASYGNPALWRMPNDSQHPYGYYTAIPYFPGPLGSNANNPGPFADGDDEERFHHPLLFNPFLLNHKGMVYNAANQQYVASFPSTEEADRLFPIGDMLNLINWQTPPSATGPLPLAPYATSQDTLNTEFAKVWPNHIKCYPRLRNLMTTHSMDLNRPGAFPGQAMLPTLPFASNQSPYVLDGSQPAGPNRVPQGPATYFSNNNAAMSLLANRQAVPAPGGDLRANDWRSILGDIGAVNLNRPLAPYPNQFDSDYKADQFIDENGASVSNGRAGYVRQWRADRDRVVLARDIFDRLRIATGAADPSLYLAGPTNLATDPTGQQFNALRYLAQLAVNIVDYVDSDDVFTAFNFLGDQLTDEPSTTAGVPIPTPKPVPGHGWVFGTELPRLVINEAYGQLQNAPTQTGEDFMIGNKGTYMAGSDFDPDTTSSSMNGGMGRPFANLQPADKMKAVATKQYRLNFFVELHNPREADTRTIKDPNKPANAMNNTVPVLSEYGAARIQMSQAPAGAPKGVYKLAIYSDVDQNLTRGVDNSIGAPKPDNAAAPNRVVKLDVMDFSPDGGMPSVDTTVVLPPNSTVGNWANFDPRYGYLPNNNGGNNGYTVLGPGSSDAYWQNEVPHDRTGSPPMNEPTPITTIAVKSQPSFDPATLGPSQMWAGIDQNLDPAMVVQTVKPTVMLQRLARPYLRAQPDASKGDYNPYVTVDYLKDVPITDAVLVDSKGIRDGSGTYGMGERQPLNQRHSQGRRQPFKAWQLTQQDPQLSQGDLVIQQTFFRQNGKQPSSSSQPPFTNTSGGGMLDEFKWLVHYDRVGTSSFDLLHVSGFRPFELTQEFMANGDPANHQAKWREPTTRLSRAMELLSTQSFMNGSAFGGRVMGKININTIQEKEVLQALCDALSQRHYFDPTTIDMLWDKLQQMRQTSTPGQGDMPIYSMGAPYGNNQDLQFPPRVAPALASVPPLNAVPYPGNGPDRSMLLKYPGAQPMFATSDQFPYNQEELLRKIAANVTTRSNVFAIYLTTAFFEVRKPQGPGDPDGDQFQPPLLGREVDMRLRHKMFAIVDRTNLSLDIQNTYSSPPPAAGLRTQGSRPIFFPLKPFVGSFSSPTAPDLKDLNVIPNDTTDNTYYTYVPAYAIGAANTLIIRDTIDHDGREYSPGPGSYSGESAKLFQGMHLFLDVGSPINGTMEEIIIETITQDATNPMNSYIKFHRIDGQPLKFKHARGAAICTVLPGNPGPQQLPIPYDDPPYSNTVVPFRTILQ